MAKLYYGDNLHVMKTLKADSIDLCYCDPPFNSNRVFYTDGVRTESVEKVFTDKWRSNITTDKDFQVNFNSRENILNWISACDALFEHDKTTWKGLRSYLLFMLPRLVEIERIVKPMGSVYIHIDQGVSHYIKCIMDAIWGSKRFIAEIAWCYAPQGRTPKVGYPRKHDSILFYGDKKKSTYHQQYTGLSPETELLFKTAPDDNEPHRMVHGVSNIRSIIKGDLCHLIG